ncbi:DUF2336 domain-containing protein [Pseudolabrys taiwanensis]|uniref:DUF2336 domain-containing protein n=1 Tax=Pseudolabrys taiwanensis TaxID=331696 RepID=A0A345ZRE2_9HYPH|nr:DUF2336 domain-containing protein [Pseudolabrys taiwanensis]AXK79489.1 DUF2336 domain-containing protein [Pseudolabrys taiwanensis]
MIVRQFLHWVRQAPPGERAEATSALARAYLHSDLSTDDLAAAEGAMIMLLDDPSPLVRRAMSLVFASAQKAPRVVVQALAADQFDVAQPLLESSPLLVDDDLIDLVASGKAEIQATIAGRPLLSRALAAAIAEVGSAEACLILLENSDACLALFSVDRIVERFGHLAPIRENLLEREDLPMRMRQALLSKLSKTLAGFVTARQWLGSDHAEYATREACEKATVALAADTPYEELGALVVHLRESGQLTAGMILRALLSGNVVLFEEALAELSGLPIDRVTSYIHDRHISGFRALYRKAELPDMAYPAFREALAALRDGVLVGEQGGAARLKRGMVERVLEACSAMRDESMVSLVALLRRFSVEAAREEARLFCDDLVAEGAIDAVPEPYAVAQPIEEMRLVA